MQFIKRIRVLPALIILIFICFTVYKIDQNLPFIHKKNALHTELSKNKYSTKDPKSRWIVVNKLNPLPEKYVPSDLVAFDKFGTVINKNENMLRQETANKLDEMFRAASADNIKLVLISGYRSFNLQQIIYESNIKKDGLKKTNETSARAGYSEHQSGFAADIGSSDTKCQLKKCFSETKTGKWLAENAHKYGFIIRYPKEKKYITGFDFEPWHLRYVGKDLSRELYKNKQTMEEFFGLPPAPIYK